MTLPSNRPDPVVPEWLRQRLTGPTPDGSPPRITWEALQQYADQSGLPLNFLASFAWPDTVPHAELTAAGCDPDIIENLTKEWPKLTPEHRALMLEVVFKMEERKRAWAALSPEVRRAALRQRWLNRAAWATAVVLGVVIVTRLLGWW